MRRRDLGEREPGLNLVVRVGDGSDGEKGLVGFIFGVLIFEVA